MASENNFDMYRKAIDDIKKAIVLSQSSALETVNKVQLLLYLTIGRYISALSRTAQWGSNALSIIADRLQKEMPGLRGFSETNLKLMRTFYEQWSFLIMNSSVATDEIQLINSNINFKEDLNLPVKAQGEIDSDCLKFNLNNFFSLPFTHHSIILTKIKDIQERLYYINVCAKDHWSVSSLKKAMADDDYHHRGQMVNNFQLTLSEEEKARRAVMAFKDQYVLDFINVEEFGARDIADVDERVVENQIVNNIKNFIMTFGKDFTFIGNQYHIEVMGHSHYIDLLFYHRELCCLVAIELKVGSFKPSYLGQLQNYLAILDDYERKPNENPSIGLILCRDVDKAYAEYVIRNFEKPMGVATFKAADDLPEKLKKYLPDPDDLKKLL